MSGRSVLLALAALMLSAAPVAAAAASAKCVIENVAELKVTMAGMKPLVSGEIDGHPTKLMADSGAFYSTIGPDAVQRFGMGSHMAPLNMEVRGTGGAAHGVFVATAKEFRFANAKIRNVEFLVVDGLGGGEVAGVIGQNVLAVFDTEYDLANGVIRLMKPTGDCGKSLPAYWAGGQSVGVLDVGWTTPLQPQLVGHAAINGQSVKVVLDTGASYSVLKLPTAERLGFRRDAPDTIAAGVGSGIGSRVYEAWSAPFASFEVGGEAIRNTRLRVSDINLEKADMLLGADFFLSHRVYVSKAQHKVYFTYNGGPVFRLEGVARTAQPQPAAAGAGSAPAAFADAPSDAAGYTRRGEADMSRHNYAAAVADFGKAAELEPSDPQHARDRARAHLAKGEPLLAMADFDAALKLRPDDPVSLIGRGELFLVTRDPGRAKADFDAAIKADPDRALQVAGIYSSAGRFEDAVTGYDAWIGAHPKADNLSIALNGRCWARAMADRQLDQALADCEAALKRGPRIAAFYDSRGLAHLRRKELDLAIADYDQALKMQPKMAWALMGRGLAKKAKGDTAGGEADIAAAAAIQPNLVNAARRNGLMAGAASGGAGRPAG